MNIYDINDINDVNYLNDINDITSVFCVEFRCISRLSLQNSSISWMISASHGARPGLLVALEPDQLTQARRQGLLGHLVQHMVAVKKP